MDVPAKTFDPYQFPSDWQKRYVDVPEGLSEETHSLMKGRANNLLFFLLNYMKLGGLVGHSMSRGYDDGSTVFINSANGIHFIRYTGPRVSAKAGEVAVKTTMVLAYCDFSSKRVYYKFLGDTARYCYLDFSALIPTGSLVREGEGFAVLEYDPSYGVIFFRDGDVFDNPSGPDYGINYHGHCILYNCNLDVVSPTSVTFGGDTYYKISNVESIVKTFSYPVTRSFPRTGGGNPWDVMFCNTSIFNPPEGGTPIVFQMDSRGTYCYLENDVPGISNLRAENYYEVFYDVGSYPALPWAPRRCGGIYNSEETAWRVHDPTGGFYVDTGLAYWPEEIHDAWVTTPQGNVGALAHPKWSALTGRHTIAGPTLLQTSYISFNESPGHSFTLSDLQSLAVSPITTHIPGPVTINEANVSGRVDGFVPAGGDVLSGRYMIRAGKYQYPYPGGGPYTQITPDDKHHRYVYIIDGVLYQHPDPVSYMIPETVGRASKEMWEAKRFWAIPNKFESGIEKLRVPTIDLYYAFTWGMPTTTSVTLTASHPDWPGETLGGTMSGSSHERYEYNPAYPRGYRFMWNELIAFGVVKSNT